MANADVAVVVPVYNRPTLSLDALNCVASQSLLPRRLVVVDDGSTDGTADAVADWLQTTRPALESSLVRLPRNGGASAARNRGLAMARDCRFIAFLDSDDLWPADFIERTSAALAAHPKAVAATTDRVHVFEETQEVRMFDLRLFARNATYWMFANDSGIVPVTLSVTERILELGGFNERLPTGHDADLFLSLSLLGEWLHVPGSPVIIRRFRQNNHGESPHLSEKYADNQRQWAQIHEDFIERKGGKRVVPRWLYVRILANRWNCAGRQLLYAGRAADARRCLMRSLGWRPWRPDVWLRLLKTYSFSFRSRVGRRSGKSAPLSLADSR